MRAGRTPDAQVSEPAPLDLRLALPALAAWLVAWQGPLVPPTALLAAAVACLLTAAGLLAHRLVHGQHRYLLAAVLACASAAGLTTGLHTAARSAGPLPELAAREAAVRLEVVLIDDAREVAPRAGPGPARRMVLARVRVEQVQAAGRTTRLRAPVLVLAFDRGWLDLLPSQRVAVEGRLRPADPGDDVVAVLSARTAAQVLSPPNRVHRVAGHLRAGLREAVSPLPERERGLLPGLVVGDVSRLGDDVRSDFRTVGLTHLTAVSGTNVAIVVGAVLLLCRRFGMRVQWSPVLAAVALVGFVVLARPSPSVLRAAVMGLVGLVALGSGSRRAAMPALATAVLVLVLVQPSLARTAGFALSVLATGGLLVLAPGWRARLRRHLPGPLADAIAVPAAAQVACGPVVVAISAQLGLLSVPANLLAVPAVAPATIAGVIAALLAPVSLPLAQVAAWVGWLPAAWLVLVARVGASAPGSTVPWPDGGKGALLLAGLTVALFAAVRSTRLRRGLLAGFAGTALMAAFLALQRPGWPPPGWVLVACDVGQGDALVVNAGAGAAIVVDAGPDPDLVDGCLRRLGVTRLPLVLLTHLHADHVDGLPGVLRGRQVALVETGPLHEPASQHGDVERQAAAERVPVQRAALHGVRTVGQVGIEVLAPARTYRGTSSDPNNSSLVVRLTVRGHRLLLTGDIEPEAQRDLLTRGIDVRADVLKVPHHGSAHQDPGFLARVGASLVLTSVGADNTYGHPAPAVLDRLTSTGAASLRTDLDGDVTVLVRDGALVAVGSRARPR